MNSIIQTERMTLRMPEASDTARIFECMQEPDLPLNLGRAPFPYTRQDAAKFIALVKEWVDSGTEYSFMLTLPDQGVIGCAGLTNKGQNYWELGYWIGKPWWGHGYATEASQALMAWGQSHLKANGFISGYIADNPSSGRVLEKLGFKEVGKIRQFVTGRGQEVDAVRLVLNAPPELALQVPH